MVAVMSSLSLSTRRWTCRDHGDGGSDVAGGSHGGGAVRRW